jgi:hypothetical protein
MALYDVIFMCVKEKKMKGRKGRQRGRGKGVTRYWKKEMEKERETRLEEQDVCANLSHARHTIPEQKMWCLVVLR